MCGSTDTSNSCWWRWRGGRTSINRIVLPNMYVPVSKGFCKFNFVGNLWAAILPLNKAGHCQFFIIGIDIAIIICIFYIFNAQLPREYRIEVYSTALSEKSEGVLSNTETASISIFGIESGWSFAESPSVIFSLINDITSRILNIIGHSELVPLHWTGLNTV